MMQKSSTLSPVKQLLLEQRLKRASPERVRAPEIPTRLDRDSAPLSFAQRQMWMIDRMTPGNPAYNVPAGYRIKGAMDVTALEDSVNEIIKRHEVLRTTFAVEDDEPLQRIHPELKITISVTALDHLSGEEREDRLQALASEESVRSFDLSRLPLIRVSMFKLGDAEHVLIVNLHHIVADGLSIGLLLDELDTFYRAFTAGGDPRPPDLAVQYADFAQWQRQTLANEAAYANQIEFWRKQLAGGLPVLELPGDMPRPPLQSFKGSNVFFNIPTSLAENLRLLGAREGCTFFMTLLAAFQVLLQRYSGADDMVIGTPVAARTPRELEPLIGNFLNMAALRCNLSGNPTFIELLRRTRDTTLNAFSNSDLPFEVMVKHLTLERDPSRNPIFQVLLQVLPATAPRIGELEISSFHFDLKFAQFDLGLHLYEDVGGYCGRFEYCTDLFHPETVKRLSQSFLQLLHAIVRNPDESIATLPILTDAERHQLLVDWNNTGALYPTPDLCVHQLIEEQAGRTPDHVAVVFEQQTLTYGELNRRANQLAHHLQVLGVGPDVLVGLFVERSLEMLVGIVSILKAGGAYVPIDPVYPKERLGYILEDSKAPIVLTQESLIGQLPRFAGQSICLDADWAAIACESEKNLAAAVKPEHLAYVLFTSGSTGRPKGVALEHRSATTFVQWAKQVFTPQELAVVLFSTSVCFDLSVFEIFVTLSAGGKIILARNALHLPTLPEKDEVTLINTVPSAIAELLRMGAVPASVKTVNLAGEALSDTLVEQIYATTNVEKVYNLYGPTEATTYSTYTLVQRGCPVTIGRPIANTQTYILDASRNPVPIGVIGELYLAGGGLARGYYGRPELTNERFVPNPFSEERGGRMYRTGDSCRWLPDGNIQYLGRADYQVKLRGFRIELEEIEATLDRHPAVRQSVVIVREEGPEWKQLVAYVIPESGAVPQIRELRQHVKERLPDFMVPSAVVPLDAFPLTPNGKINRKALPAPSYENLQAAHEFVRPQTETEWALAAIWSEVLKVENIGNHDDFFDLGGHSLLAIKTVSRIRDVFEVELPTRTLFENPTIADLSNVLTEAKRSSGNVRRIERRMQSGPCSLSFAQERFWLVHQLAPASPVYNVVDVIRFEGTFDADAMRSALKELVRRHEVLRTAFAATHGQPMQIVLPTIELVLSELDLSAVSAPEREREWVRVVREEGRKPFDLSHAPLLRGTLVHLSPRDHQLLLTSHHIIADEWSMEVMHQEVKQLYEAFSQGQPSPLLELPIQYSDFACWQRDWLQGDVLQRQLAYWTEVLARAPSMLDLPTDKPRPAVQSFRGATEIFALPKELVERVKALGRQEQATLFMILEASFMALLNRYTGQDDILVGTPISGRTHSETERLIGSFINTVVLRAQFANNLTFRSLLHQVREQALGAYAHPDLPFEQLIAALAPERDPSRTPLFQVMFVLHNSEGVSQVSKVSGNRQLETGTSKCDLSLFISETADGLEGIFEYSTGLFEAQTIRRLCGHFRTLLEAISREPDRSISSLPMLTDAERQQLVVGWNDTRTEYPADALIHELFEAQARRTPDAVAVEYEGHQLTYGELNARANQVAHYLARYGVGPDLLVGICVERSLDMVVGILGILKAGGAYVPLDPDYPALRLSLMLDDTAAPLLLTQARLRARLSGYRGRMVSLDDDWPEIARERKDDPKVRVSVRSLAYVIYTSGSTGRPKGTCIEHRSVVRLVKSTNYAELGPQEVFLQFAPLSFDASTFELWGSLLNGAKLVVCPAGALSLKELAGMIQERGVTTLWLTTALFHQMVDEQIESLRGVRQLLAGGETLSVSHVRRMLEVIGKGRLMNCYGPTENTTFTCCHVMTTDSRIELTVPIGRPISNTRVYVLDSHMHPVPVGVYGELYIGGDGLAREYLHQPQLTSEKFIPDPFSREVGARLYRSGDLVRFRADGCIEFLGRIDNQVKIRGYRIEPGEISVVLNTYTTIRDSHVLARRRKSGELSLCAYYVADPMAGNIPTDSELTSFLRERLPNYMVPGSLIRVEAIPLTPNGKIEHQALPDPESDPTATPREFVEPRDETERVLCRIWSETLKLDRVGIDDDFFAIGGHSLLAAKLFSRLDEQFGRSLPLGVLFSAPTVRALAERYRTMPEQQFRALVALKKSGSRTPVFAVPGVFGNVLGFAELCRELGSEQPFYGLQSVGLDGSEAPLTSIEEIAKLNIRELLAVQPQGPYVIIGACFGATVAYEMARQLLEEGEEVAFLGLLGPTDREGNGENGDHASVPRVCRRAMALGDVLSNRWRLYLEEMQGLTSRDRIKYLTSKIFSLGASIADENRLKGVQRELNQIEVYRANLLALDCYRRKPLNGCLRVLKIFQPVLPGTEVPEPIDWKEFWKGCTKVHHVGGKDSGDMLSGENARVLGALLTQQLHLALHAFKQQDCMERENAQRL